MYDTIPYRFIPNRQVSSQSSIRSPGTSAKMKDGLRTENESEAKQSEASEREGNNRSKQTRKTTKSNSKGDLSLRDGLLIITRTQVEIRPSNQSH
jgi:hypothetical protein